MKIIPFVNSPVPSNTYIVQDNSHAIIIDPGSKDESALINYIKKEGLTIDYIMLTHEHFDHIWGAKILSEIFKAPILCSEICASKVVIPQNYYNRLYFNDDAEYYIPHVDFIIKTDYSFLWREKHVDIYMTPGHSNSCITIVVDGHLFTGDTIMKGFRPLIKRRHGGCLKDFITSVKFIFNKYEEDTLVYPGHGEIFKLGDVKQFYSEYIQINS